MNPDTSNKTFKSYTIDLLQTVTLALAIFLIVYLFLFQPHQVRGESMLPNFENNEYLLTDKISYRFISPGRGDVVVFAAPPSPGEDYIKRIVGLPKEEILLQDGKIYTNGQLLEEPYLKDTKTEAGVFLQEGKSIILKSDEYLVLGDNRDNSSDSRRWGPIKRGKIVGRAWLIYWPPKKLGFVTHSP